MRGDTLEFRDRIPFRHDRTSAGSFHMAHDDGAADDCPAYDLPALLAPHESMTE